MDGKAFLTMVCSTAFALALNATTYTSASYVKRDHLMAQWDAIDNTDSVHQGVVAVADGRHLVYTAPRGTGLTVIVR